MNSDIVINQSADLRPIVDIAKELGIDDAIEQYGPYKAKIDTFKLKVRDIAKPGKLILVTSINPTAAGEGKTTTTIGLSDALNLIGKKSIVCLREPAIGPVFGMKGGATGGGYAQVAPMEDINLHFTGDFSAIASAHNLLAAMVDNHIHQGNHLGIDKVTWRRVIDMNDRKLRDGFDIVVASEVMAVLCLVNDINELKERLGNITVGYNSDGNNVTARDLKANGAMAALLKNAIKPNLVQTLHGNPAIIHGGPFANIAHGCNSVIATKLGMQLADFTVTEAGFGSDLGAEKFLDIKCRKSGLWPDAVVIVATVRAVRLHGAGNLQKGFYNLRHHIKNISDNYNLPVVVCINKFSDDADDNIHWIRSSVSALGVEAVLATHWKDGAEGAVDLANAVIKLSNKETKPRFVYADSDTLKMKIEKIIRNVYGGRDCKISQEDQKKLQLWDKTYRHYPICIAKTHSSLSTNPDFMGIPSGEIFSVRALRLCTGAEYIVVLMGNIVTLPGLPLHPSAEKIDIDNDGNITGLN